MSICPKCGSELENYNRQEGGWCPKCQEWWPSDVVEDYLSEIDDSEPDEDFEDGE